MAVAAEGSPHAISYLYVVGGEDYVFREVKRRLLKLGVNVVGHAAYRWKNSLFEVPKLTTAILVVTDECRNDMRARAHEQGKKWEIPVIEAPAREHWGHAEEALRKYGIIEAMAGVVPIIAAAPSPEALPATPRTTLGEAIAAKGEVLTPVPTPAKRTIVMAAQPAKKEPAPPAKPMKKVDKEAAQRALILELLRESKAKVGNKPICEIVQKKLGECSVHTVRKIRKEGKFPPARPGALSAEQVGFFKKYGIEFTQTPQEGVEGDRELRPPKVAKAESRPAPSRPEPAEPKPKAARRGRPGKHDAEMLPSDEQVTEAFREAVRFLDETLVRRLHLTSLTLCLENGTWQAPEFERVKVTRGTVKLK